ncbi:MAG: elongation factor G, partial [Spirochaetaceae bacterium]|nr:elongation factor G [Spirochaetaceae bacterium]
TYRESVTREVEYTGEFSRTIGGKEQTAGVTLRIAPCDAPLSTQADIPDASALGNRYVNAVRKAGSVPEEIFDAIERAVTGSFASGIQYGYPCTNISVTLTAVDYSELTSTAFAFEACTVAAFDEGCRKASPELLEPVMNVDILCPKEFVGDAISQITQRGGIISSLESKPSTDVIYAQAPMAKMFGFSTALRSVTQGRASFMLEFSHFEVKPGGLGSV